MLLPGLLFEVTLLCLVRIDVEGLEQSLMA